MQTTLIAPAKLNLHLDVGAARADGYHDVTTVLLALDLGDEVTVEPAPSLSVMCTPDVGIVLESNLAWRAAVAMGEAFGRSPDFAVTITKHVPPGAGLGGGSADAAAVIAALASAWGIAGDDTRLDAVAASLGADVLFPLRGGCALFEGRGDVLARRLPLPHGYFAIVGGPAPISTADAYEQFDDLEEEESPGTSELERALASGDTGALGAALYNNMTDAALELVPEVEDALDAMESAPGCAGATLCGSGSAIFGVFADEYDAEDAADAARIRGLWASVARARAGGALDRVTGANL